MNNDKETAEYSEALGNLLLISKKLVGKTQGWNGKQIKDLVADTEAVIAKHQVIFQNSLAAKSGID